MTEPTDDLAARWVSAVLVAGTALSIGVVLIGVVLTLLASPVAEPAGGSLVVQIAAGKPASIVALGLALLVLTPVAELIAVLIAFARHGERRYVAITCLVLGLLAAGVVSATFFSNGAGG